jgi:hypothetical protein
MPLLSLRSRALALVLPLSLLHGAQAQAQTNSGRGAAATDPSVVEARRQFVRGAALAKSAQWTEALESFEQSSRLRPHPITTYNIAACERALGRFTAAREHFHAALDAVPKGDLPESIRSEIKVYLGEIERLLAHVELKVQPADTAVTLNGRPSRSSGILVLDPGTHIFTLSRKGYSNAVVTKTFKPGTREVLTLNLDRLPAQLHVSSNEKEAVVQINRVDVGYAPVVVERPAGSYLVRVEKPGFVAYESVVGVNAGEAATIKAKISPTPITQRWWFWSLTGLVVSGAVIGTYYATRSEPTPQRPPPDGGSVGWTVELR